MASQMGLVQGLLAADSVGHVYVSTYYPHHYARMDRVVTLRPPPVRGYTINRSERELLATGALVTWGGGVDLQDLGSKLKLCLLWLRFILLKRYGSKIILGCQGTGPLRSRCGKVLVARIVQRLDGGVVREPTARRLVAETGNLPSACIHESCDAAFMLEPPDPAFGQQYLEEKGFDLKQPVLGVNVRRWYHERGGWFPSACRRRWVADRMSAPMQRLLNHMAEAIARQTVARQILLLPMYRREPEPWEDDIDLLEALQARLPTDFHAAMVDEDLATPALLSILSGLSALVGVRLHSTILAQVAGVPALHIAYDHKGVEHFQRMDMASWCLPIQEVQAANGADLLARKLAELLAHRATLAQTVAQRTQTLRTDAKRQLHELVDEVKNG